MLITVILPCFCVCLAGQTRRRSEEEQGDEGGSLPIDEQRCERKERKSRTGRFLSRFKKIKKGNQSRTQKQLEQRGERRVFIFDVCCNDSEQAVQSLARS